MSLIDKVKQAGVVGAGGAGFPTHVKLGASVEWYIANGAECEPLMHKDRELMTHFAAEIVAGLLLAADSTRSRPAIGVKRKNRAAIAALKDAIKKSDVKLCYFDDYYPAGDEYEIVHTITGRLIPPQGLPLDVGCVVNNVETLYNIYNADRGVPVTETFMTITGCVRNPLTTWVPIGMRAIDVLDLAGGTTIDDFAIMESGLMMGKVIQDSNQPVTKTTGGLIVLPQNHNVISRYSKTQKQMDRIGHAACDQCSYCTELCPRYLLGYDVQPHLVMRSLGFSHLGAEIWSTYAQLCCQCGLCTLYACPEALYPREACMKSMNDLRAIGRGKWEGARAVKPHATKEFRRVPVRQLMTRLGVQRYEAEAGYVRMHVQPSAVTIPLKQHIGAPSEPLVKKGESVQKGQLIARPPEGQLGATIHASISGSVSAIENDRIIIEA
ncbi:4Fe-4S dicluster domain-containing protein [candidate division KSB1 bacterium]|nr:4Fe-4S dicluster domain-containing protein [candidate division KSB1 bacterium]